MTEEKEEKRPRKRLDPKKKATILVAALVIVAAGGLGFWKWHETPGFCAAICHNMDQYLATYLEPQNAPGVDKYGNPVSNTNAMMSVLHRSNATTGKSEILCLDCHHAVIGEQVSEGMYWATGNYLDPLDERVGGHLTAWWKEDSTRFCVNENCHAYLLGEDGLVDRSKLEQSTWMMEFNPHSQYHEAQQMECTACHKGHRASVQNCTSCHEHENIALPDGWITATESKELMEKTFVVD